MAFAYLEQRHAHLAYITRKFATSVRGINQVGSDKYCIRLNTQRECIFNQAYAFYEKLMLAAPTLRRA
jgi:hypothetical protein